MGTAKSHPEWKLAEACSSSVKSKFTSLFSKTKEVVVKSCSKSNGNENGRYG